MSPTLFETAQLGPLTLRNRVIKSPQTTATSNPDGTVTDRTVNHYRRLGEGGVGLVMVEYTYVDDDASKSIHNQTGLSRREHVPGMGWLVDEVHSTGALVGIQLNHTGRQKFLGTAPIKSASTSSWDYVEMQNGVVPQPMTVDEIHGVVESFAAAAVRAHNARFDLVEVHAGHGYLLTNFLSPFTNNRTDEYGGSPANRRRILIEIVDAIRARVPRDFPISVRLSVTDYEPTGIAIEETVELCRELEAHGVDVIHASGGHHALMQYEVSPWYMPRQIHRWGWEKIKPAVTIPVIGSGSLVTPTIAEEIVSSGSADFVSLGRAMLADPSWADKARTGRLLEIVPCIRCNDGCLDRGLDAERSTGCTVNPEMGEEGRFPVLPAGTKKRVAVVGGGPAGLRAAQVLHDRGHEVTLYEPGRLGGLLAHAFGSDVKQDLQDLVNHLVHEVIRRGITVAPQRADAATLTGYDSVVVATGAPQREYDGPVAAGAQVIRADEISAYREKISGNVVVVGAGFQGCDSAIRLTEIPDVSITVVDRQNEIMAGNEVKYDRFMLPPLLESKGVTFRLGTEVTAVGEKSVTLADGTELPADWVITAVGRAPSTSTLPDELRAAGIETVVVGSAGTPGRVYDALHTAYFRARLV